MTYGICAMRIKFASGIRRGDVDEGLIKERDDFKVGRGLEELHSQDRALRDETGTAARLRTPCNFDTLGVGDG